MNSCKKLKNEPEVCTHSNRCFDILTLPDDIMLYILQYLDTISLAFISQVCHRLYRLTHDKTLEQHIDIRLKPLCIKDLWKVLNRKLTHKTKDIHLKGNPENKTKIMEKITVAFMNRLCNKCPDLSSLSLECFDLRELPLDMLPPNMKKLSLRGSMLTMGWFDYLKNNIKPDITYLDLHSCSKISNNDLEALAYLQNIETLILCNCFRISARGIPSVTKNMKKLKHIDFSGCPGVNNVVLFYLSELQLEYLGVRFCHLITCTGLNQLFQYDVGKTLKVLDLYSCHELTDDALDVINTKTYCLQMLDIGGCNKISLDKILEVRTLMLNCMIKFVSCDYIGDRNNANNDCNHEVNYSGCCRVLKS